MFKEILNDDLNVFLNIEEFGEEVLINGFPILVVEDNETMKEYKVKHLELLNEETILFFCRTHDLNQITIENFLTYNGNYYNVVSKEDYGGVYQVILSKTTQGTIREWVQ